MRAKSDTLSIIPSFYNLIQNQFNTSIKQIRSDNGLEFNSLEFYASKGIVHQLSCVETPQQNGVVERKHQTLLVVARSLLFQSGLPTKF